MGENIMITVEFIDNAIEFLDRGLCFYDLTVSEIKKQGIDFWLDHLSRKNWFTDDVKKQFLALLK